MGKCRDFGSQIAEGCDHLMRAGSDSCACEECGVVCKGRFEACPSIWARGPQPVTLVAAPPEDPLEVRLFGPRDVNGQAPTTNGTHAASLSSSPTPANATGTDVFRWFQTAFDALRQEVQGLHTALLQEQAVVAKLLDERKDDKGLDPDALRDVVDAAVRKAMRNQADDLRNDVSSTVAGLRRDLEALTRSQEERGAGLEASIARAEAAVAEASTASAGLPAELSRRDALNRRALRMTLQEQFMPLVEVVAESVAQTEHELQSIDLKLEELTDLGASMAAALDEVADAVAELAPLEPEAAAPTPPASRPARGGPIAALRPSPERRRAGGMPAEAPGNRVSLRRHPTGQ